jgi:hypothetical protein
VTVPGCRESVEAYIRAEALPKDKFGHQPRLYALACRPGEGMEYDDILFAASWMHDLEVLSRSTVLVRDLCNQRRTSIGKHVIREICIRRAVVLRLGKL